MIGFLGWIKSYEKVQLAAVILLYAQIACALAGSLGAFCTGVSLANLAIALFALVAIESGSQGLGRTYAVLLACSLVLDTLWLVLWFEFRAPEFRKPGKMSVLSLRLVLWSEIIGCILRTLSAALWWQIYRLGASSTNNEQCYQRLPHSGPRSWDNTPESTPRRTSTAPDDEILGGSIYDPTYYTSVSRVQDVKGLSDSGGFSMRYSFHSAARHSPVCSSLSQALIQKLVDHSDLFPLLQRH